MSAETLRGAPQLPGQRPIPSGERTSPAVGPMPWLTATGRLEQVLTAWSRGQLAEVAAGLGFDVLLPPPTVCRPATVPPWGWLVPPAHEATGAPLCTEATPRGALLEPYLAALQAAEDAEADSGE